MDDQILETKKEITGMLESLMDPDKGHQDRGVYTFVMGDTTISSFLAGTEYKKLNEKIPSLSSLLSLNLRLFSVDGRQC